MTRFRFDCFIFAFIGLLGIVGDSWATFLAIGWRDWWVVAIFVAMLVYSCVGTQHFIASALRGEP